MLEKASERKIVVIIFSIAGIIIVLLMIFFLFIYPAISRYQQVLNRENQNKVNLLEEENKIEVNRLKIQQTEQLIQVENQKSLIKVAEAKGIADAQGIINSTLSDKYLQLEAIKAQGAMANSPNHTTVYIPSGQNGIPLVKTLEDK